MRTRLAMQALAATLHDREASPWLSQMTDDELDQLWSAAVELVHQVLAERKVRLANRSPARTFTRALEEVVQEEVHSGETYRLSEENRERIRHLLVQRLSSPEAAFP